MTTLVSLSMVVTGPEVRRTGKPGDAALFVERVDRILAEQDPWCLWVTRPDGDEVMVDVLDRQRVRDTAAGWWAAQGLRPDTRTHRVVG